MKYVYRNLLQPILFLFNAERVHNAFTKVGELLGKTAIGRKIVATFYDYRGKDISKTVDGITYRTPVMLSAGFDYNGRLTQILPSLGFGGVEVGSITLKPYEGNPKPRMTRLIKNKSIIINKGLKNEGVDNIISRLQKRKAEGGKRFVVGISIARTNDPSTTSTRDGIIDYFTTLKKLVKNEVGDYYTINISCPNAFGGESFTEPKLLDQLLTKLTTIKHNKPMYLKMPINKPWKEFRELLKIAVDYSIHGVIIGNLNKNYDDLEYRKEAPREYRGGLSGTPCRKRSNDLIKNTKDTYGDKLTIIGCGGIMTPDDAIEKFELGCDLVQLITGMIFEGPQLIKSICTKISLVDNSNYN